MPTAKRALYTLLFLTVFSAIAMLTMIVMDVGDIKLPYDVPAILGHPGFVAPLVAVGWAVAPWLAKRLPVNRAFFSREGSIKPTSRLTTYAIAGVALVISMSFLLWIQA